MKARASEAVEERVEAAKHVAGEAVEAVEAVKGTVAQTAAAVAQTAAGAAASVAGAAATAAGRAATALGGAAETGKNARTERLHDARAAVTPDDATGAHSSEITPVAPGERAEEPNAG